MTLIELLIVMLIIGLLIALLLPLIGRVRQRALRTEVVTEIRMLDDAIKQFRHRYGVYPPSRIHFREPGDFKPGPLPTRAAEYLRRIWPDFAIDTPVDLNGDDDTVDILRMNGSECLVFFLGGMSLPYVPAPSGSGETLLSIARVSDPSLVFEDVTRRGMEGFCRNASFPFARSTDTIIPGHEDRTEVFFEFDPGRLSDVDADGCWEYYPPNLKPPGIGAFDPDLQPHPYTYLSSYDGAGYNVVQTLQDKDGDQRFDIRITHDAAWGGVTSPLGLRWPLSRNEIQLDSSTSPPYTVNLPANFSPSSIEWWNPRSFQIIAPGLDGMIGGGDLGTTNPGVAAFDPHAGVSTVTDEMLDNLTNFSNGELSEIE